MGPLDAGGRKRNDCQGYEHDADGSSTEGEAALNLAGWAFELGAAKNPKDVEELRQFARSKGIAR